MRSWTLLKRYQLESSSLCFTSAGQCLPFRIISHPFLPHHFYQKSGETRILSHDSRLTGKKEGVSLDGFKDGSIVIKAQTTLAVMQPTRQGSL